MSSFSRLRRAALLSLAVAGVALLSACTFGPVYEDQGAAQAMEIGLAPPSNPLEQIVYQELQRRFGVSSNPGAPQVSVTVSTASRALAQSVTADPAKDSIMTATGVLRITRDGQPVLTTDGMIVEPGRPADIFETPSQARTQAFISQIQRH